MANDQSLFEFLKNIVSDLENGSITSQEALVACNQYAYVRDVLQSKSELLTQAATTGNNELFKTVQTILTELVTSVQSLPSFQSQTPDAPETEKEIKHLTALRDASLKRVEKETKEKLRPYESRRQAFINEVIKKYSNRLSSEVVNAALAHASSASTPSEAIAQVSKELSVPIDDTGKQYVQEIFPILKTEHEIVKTILERVDITRPDVVADILLNAPPGENLEETKERAIKLAGVAAELQKPFQHKNTTLFTSNNAKGMTRGIQAAADGILSVVGEPFREIIYKNKVEGTLRSMLSNTQKFTDRLGEAFVQSNVFTQTIQSLTKSLGERASGVGGRNVLGDVFTSVFRGPLDHALIQGSGDRMLDFMELARANANAPQGFGFMPVNIGPWNVPWEYQQTKPRRKGFFPSIGLGGVGGAMGNIFAVGVDRTVSTIFNNPFLGPRVNYARRRSGLPTLLKDDLPLQVALVVVIGMLVITIFPYLNKSLKNNSILVSLYNKMDTGDAGLDTGSKYIEVSKTPSADAVPNGTASLTYTINISATTDPITITAINDIFSVYSKSGSPSLSSPTPQGIGTIIQPGSPYSYNYTVSVKNLRDASVTNVITVTADVDGLSGETKTNSAYVAIGTPPTGCFVPEDSGPTDDCGSGGSPVAWGADWGKEVQAIAVLSKSTTYINQLCEGKPPIPMYRVRVDFGGGCHSNGGIYIYDKGISGFGTSVYTLAHESGHVLAVRSAYLAKFILEGIPAPPPLSEGFLPTYPNKKTIGEDFAETMGMYVGYHYYYPGKWNVYPKYPNAFPRHYNFAKEVFGDVEY